jgi:hypothetical protein
MTMTMSSNTIPGLVESLGGLHDAMVLRFVWQRDEKRLEIDIDDLHANFAGLSGYQGPVATRVVLTDVARAALEVNLAEEGLMIYSWDFKEAAPPGFVCEISFSPGGRVIVECGHIECIGL